MEMLVRINFNYFGTQSSLYFPVILSPPLPVNASLGLTAEFTCICHYCTGQYWLVNSISANHRLNYDKGVRHFESTPFFNGSKLYTVTMPASVQLNQSTVQCVVYNGSNPRIKSSAAKLLVQGK